MSSFGVIPPEPPVITSLDVLAPKFRAAVLSVIPAAVVHISETERTNERQVWLYGFGREYDDDRGIVTNAPNAFAGWHFFCLALDFKDPQVVRDNAQALRDAGLSLGLDWPRFVDPPHVQWGYPMRQSPSSEAKALYESGGLSAVWEAVQAL